MKKTILLLVSVLFALSANAQENLYHHVGDTIIGRSPIYFYDWWNEESIQDSVQLESTNVLPIAFDGVVLRYNYTDKPLNIIGLAGAMYSMNNFADEIDTTYYQEYLLLYEADSSGYHRLDSVAWNLRDPHRILDLTLHLQEDPWGECGGFYLWDKYLKMYEYYFSKPCAVTDSFYVGTTLHSNNVPHDVPGANRTYPSAWCYKESSFSPSDCPLLREFDYISYPVNDTVYYFDGDRRIRQSYEWHRISARSFMLIFPIVEVVCSEPKDLAVAPQDDGSYMLTWTGEDNAAWEAQVVRASDTLVEEAFVWCDTTTFLMDSLEPNVHYMAYVRSICIYEGDTVRTDWRNIPFTTTDSTMGISETNRMMAVLSPNPTTGKVKISCDERIKVVKVFDMAGKEVGKTRVRGQQSTEMDLSGLPNGTYLVKIETAKGVVTKKLVKK